MEVFMRVFVTGASGWIGSAVVPELLNAGHKVLGLILDESRDTYVRPHLGVLRDQDVATAEAEPIQFVASRRGAHEREIRGEALIADAQPSPGLEANALPDTRRQLAEDLDTQEISPILIASEACSSPLSC